MPKSKKKKNKDFQKVKLKVGRHLKQADNETTSRFQTTQVHVAQKLKTASSESPSKKEFKLQDLLLLCRHYSPNARAEAISNMKELITSKPEVLQTNLNVIIESMSESFSDKEINVRSAGIKLSKLIFSRITEDQLSPFFGIISAHLSCSMTHIMDDIRLDSLKLFDQLLDSYPQLVIQKSSQLLPNFIDQISKQRQGGLSKGEKLGRSLSLNPDSRTSTHKWRLKVLTRIRKLLGILSQQSTKEGGRKNDSALFDWTENTNPIQVFPNYIQHSWTGEGYILDLKEKRIASGSTSEFDLQSFVDVLVPLLLECWMESMPDIHRMSNMSGNSLPGNSVGLLFEVLNVMQLLLVCSCKQESDSKVSIVNLIRDKYLRDIDQQVINMFPYTINTHSQKKDQTEISVETFNLTICKIMAHMMSETIVDSQLEGDWLEKIRDFICHLGNQKLPSEEFKDLIGVIKRLTFVFPKDPLNELIVLLHDKNSQGQVSNKNRQAVLELMEDVCLSPTYKDIIRESFTCRFLLTLPKLFISQSDGGGTLRAVILRLMKTAANQRNTEFLSSLHDHGIEVLDTLPRLPRDLQRPLVELVYSIPRFGNTLLHKISAICMMNDVPEDIAMYLLSITEIRLLQTGQTLDMATCSLILKFIFTLVAGYTMENEETITTPENSMWCYKLITEESQTFNRKTQISRFAHKMLKMVPGLTDLVSVIEHFIQNILIKDTLVPKSTACSILNCWAAISKEVSGSGRSTPDRIVQLILVVMEAQNTSVYSDELEKAWLLCVKEYPRCLHGIYAHLLRIIEDGSFETEMDTIVTMACMPLRCDDVRSTMLDSQLKENICHIRDTIKAAYSDRTSTKTLNDFSYFVGLL